MAGCALRAIEYWESGKRGTSLEYANRIFEELGKKLTIGAPNNE